jgi:hypothetical protein
MPSATTRRSSPSSNASSRRTSPKSLVDGSLNYALAELAALPAAAVVIDERYGALLNDPHTQPGWLLELTARLQVRYPTFPLVFADSRKLAEEYTYRYLAAALVHHLPDHAARAGGDIPEPS